MPFALVGGTAIGTGRGELVTPVMTRGEYWWVVAGVRRRACPRPTVYARVRRAARPARSGRRARDPRRADGGAARPRRRRRSAPRWPTTCRPRRCGCARSSAPPWSRAGSSRRTARSLSGSGPSCLFLCDRPRARRRRWPAASGRSASGRVVARARAGARRPGRRRRDGRGLTDGSRRNLVNLERVTRRTASGRCSTTSASASARATGSASSAATATARPRCCGCSAACEAARRRAGCPATAACAWASSPRATTSTPRRTVRDGRCSATAPTTSGPRDSATREVVEVLLAGVALDRRGRRALRRRAAPLLAGPAAARRPRPAASSTSRPTTSTSRPSPGWPGTCAARVPARSWWSPTTAGSSTRSAPRTWEVHDGVVDVYDGGYAAFVLAKAERQRQAAASEARRQNLVRKELAWLRRGPPARTSKPKFRIDAANALIEDEPPPRDRLELQRFATAAARQGRHRPRGRRPGPRRPDAALARRPGGSVPVTGSAWSASTAPARPPCCGWSPATLEPTPGRVRRGRTVALAHLTQALDHLDPRSGCSTRSSRSQRVTGPRRRRDHRVLDAGAVRLHRRPADRPDRRPVRRRAAPASSCCGCCSPSPTCCCSTSPPTTSTSRR